MSVTLSMWKFIAIVLIGVAIVLLIAATQSSTFRVQRTAIIRARPEKVFSYINDLHQWRAWSPYDAHDPQMKRVFSGANDGPGAVLEWAGNRKAGTGRLEITGSSSPNRVAMKLDLTQPLEAHNRLEFTLVPRGAFTEVTWAMTGPNPFFGKIMQVFGIMDRILGKEFDTGLAHLKAVAEA
jgi:hypothetical protein